MNSLEPVQVRRYFEARVPGAHFNGRAEVAAHCPWHDDRHSSLSLNLDKGVWFCHAGCGDGGLLDFEQRFSGCDRDTARKNVDGLLGASVFGSTGRKAEAIYRYTDARGRLLFEKLRFPDKHFQLRHEGEDGRWIYSLEGVKHKPLYRLPAVLTANSVMVCEGEKDCENVAAALATVDAGKDRVAATTNFDGALKWKADYSPYFAGRDVVICADNDDVGRRHAEQVAASVSKYAAGVKTVHFPELPEHGDVSDFLASHSPQDLIQRVKDAPPWKPAEPTNDWRSLFHTYEDFVNAPPLRFAINNFLQEDGVTMIAGPSGDGKTLMMLSMVRALLEATPLFGHSGFTVDAPAERVLYLVPESGMGPFWHRVKLFHLEEHVRDGKLLIQTLSSREPLALNDPRLLAAAEGAYVFLDTAIRFMVGDESAAEDAKMFSQRLFNLQAAGARTITGAHHSPKSFGTADFMTLENVLRGSGDIGAMLAACWGIRKTDDSRTEIYVQNVKARDFEPCGSFLLEGRPHIDELGAFKMLAEPGEAGELSDYASKGKPGPKRAPDDAQRAVRARELYADGSGHSMAEIATQMGVSKKKVFTWIHE